MAGSLFSGEALQSAERLAMAVVLGLCLGINREMRGKAAGLRSHMLVALAASAFTIMTFIIVEEADKFGENVRADPIRLMEAVVAGIAFLGAGVVIQSRGTVVGITTGASMWLAGAIGVACGIGQYGLAFMITLLGLFILWILGWVEARYFEDSGASKTDE